MSAKSTYDPNLLIMLMFDGLQLFLPQFDVQSVEIMADVLVIHTRIGAVGWFGQHGHAQDSPIFCLAGDLTLLQDLPEEREYFLLIEDPTLPIGVACDEVETVNAKTERLFFQPLPEIMKTPDSPISYLLMYQGKMSCVCEGHAFVKYVNTLSESFADNFGD